MKNDPTKEWQQYQRGIDYNNKIDLYSTNNKHERFYADKQWEGVKANGLPLCQFNIIKRVINYYISYILSENITSRYKPENVGDNPETEEEEFVKYAADLITKYSDTLWEKNTMFPKLRELLLNAALSGDMCVYSFWNKDIETGQGLKGDIDVEIIDSGNVFFGNPNDRNVEKQPYIIISFRELVANLKKEAKENGISNKNIEKIVSDTDTDYEAGDRAKIELDSTDEETEKATTLLKLWKKDGTVYAKKSTKFTDIRNEWDTGLKRYPLAWENWDIRKNSYHGHSPVTGIIPNQMFINKSFAMSMASLMNTAYPKVLYNKDILPSGVDNQVGAAIGIEGSEDIRNVVEYLTGADMSHQARNLIDDTMKYTKEMLNANDAALGDVRPENTSAIIAVQQQSAIPLESIRQNLYSLLKQIGYNWLDLMVNHYGKRKVEIEVLGQREIKELDFSRLKNKQFRIKIDVGPSTFWSEIKSMEILDNLLREGYITFEQYLERQVAIPQKEQLLADVKEGNLKQQFIYEQMAKYLEQLPPEYQEVIQSLGEEEQEAYLMELMMLPPEEQSAKLQELMPQQPQEQQPQQMQEQQNQNIPIERYRETF